MIKKLVRKGIENLGYSIKRNNPAEQSAQLYKKGFYEDDFIQLYELCKPFTMTSIERMYSLYLAVNYVIKYNIVGDFIECGVWKGGSTMLMAYLLKRKSITNIKIVLYDTFEGMSKPQEIDKSLRDEDALERWKSGKTENDYNEWCYSPIDEVKKNMKKTGYDENNIIFIKGMVENTLPKEIYSKSVAILRLDTDWYQSTYHELNYLFPLISKNGVLLVDDYGHWKGCKKAVDEYFDINNKPILLNKIDYSGVIGIKTY